MKKRVLIILMTLCTWLIANPIQDYTHLSELQIVEPDNWTIEICNYARELSQTDSLVLETLSGRSKIVRRGILNFVVINQDCLADSLTMSRECDQIRLNYYFKDGSLRVDEVKIGTYLGSYIHNLRPDQSICRWSHGEKYFKNNTPSLGVLNTRDDQNMGRIHGVILRADGNILREKTVYFYNDPHYPHSVKTNWNGNYSIDLEARYYEMNSLYIGEYDQTVNYQSNNFDLEPGDSVEVNFYSTMTSIIPVIQNNIITFNNYPHPASSYTWFYIDNTQVEASAMRVNVYALNGRKVDSFIPTARQFRYDCAHLPQGSYVMILQHGNEVLATKKLQILK